MFPNIIKKLSIIFSEEYPYYILYYLSISLNIVLVSYSGVLIKDSILFKDIAYPNISTTNITTNALRLVISKYILIISLLS